LAIGLSVAAIWMQADSEERSSLYWSPDSCPAQQAGRPAGRPALISGDRWRGQRRPPKKEPQRW